MLVLDDYHVIDAPDIQDGMAFLLEHLPPQVHLVITTRADPALPLARLRARGELVEIRAADLRFTPDEAAAYLNEVMGLDLTARDVAALEGRTEGWIAALQLAALSMQGRDDVAGFIAGFAGDDRYIVDYLVEEVLHRQPDQVRSFLLQTSILDRLSGPLCDAVTGAGRRQGHARGARSRRTCSWSRSTTAASGIATTSSSPTCCGRACSTSSPTGVAELHRRASDVVRAERRPVRGDPPRDGRRGLRAGGGPGRARDPGDEPASTGGHAAPVARGAPRRAAPGPARAEQRVRRVAPRQGRGRGRRGAAAGRRAVARRDGRGRGWTAGRRARWSSSTRRRSAGCRARSPCTGPARP